MFLCLAYKCASASMPKIAFTHVFHEEASGHIRIPGKELGIPFFDTRWKDDLLRLLGNVRNTKDDSCQDEAMGSISFPIILICLSRRRLNVP